MLNNLYMKYIHIKSMSFELKNIYDTFGKEEIYAIISSKYKTDLFVNNNNTYICNTEYFIPYNEIFNISLFDKDYVSEDDNICNIKFTTGQHNKDNLKIDYDIVCMNSIEDVLRNKNIIKRLNENNNNNNNLLHQYKKNFIILKEQSNEKINELTIECNRLKELIRQINDISMI